MIKKWIIALISLSLFSTAYFAQGKEDPAKTGDQKDAGKKDDNNGKKKSEEANKGKQGDKMKHEHSKDHKDHKDGKHGDHGHDKGGHEHSHDGGKGQ